MPGLRSSGIFQIAYMVDDIDAAAEKWARQLKVGPFFIRRHVEYAINEYRGEPVEADVSLAFAYSGDTNIELVQLHNDAPSVWRDFLRAHGPGLQHLGVLSEDLDTDTAQLAAQGIGLVQRLVNPNGVETRFFDTEFHPGAMLELIQRTPMLDAGFAAMRQAARDWDGVTIVHA